MGFRRKQKFCASRKCLIPGARGLLRPPRLTSCCASILLLPELENCSRGGILNIHLIYGSLLTAL